MTISIHLANDHRTRPRTIRMDSIEENDLKKSQDLIKRTFEESELHSIRGQIKKNYKTEQDSLANFYKKSDLDIQKKYAPSMRFFVYPQPYSLPPSNVRQLYHFATIPLHNIFWAYIGMPQHVNMTVHALQFIYRKTSGIDSIMCESLNKLRLEGNSKMNEIRRKMHILTDLVNVKLTALEYYKNEKNHFILEHRRIENICETTKNENKHLAKSLKEINGVISNNKKEHENERKNLTQENLKAREELRNERKLDNDHFQMCCDKQEEKIEALQNAFQTMIRSMRNCSSKESIYRDAPLHDKNR